MTIREHLRQQLRRWDDETFAALANRGLLRRAKKDLETSAPVVIAESDAALEFEFGVQRLRFDSGGPAKATCSCPTSGVCQHILAVALWLQGSSGDSDSLAVVDVDTSSPTLMPPQENADALALLHAALLRITPAEMLKHAGKPGYRWAWQFVQDLDPERGLKLAGEKNILIGFARPRVDFRYPGGGIEALIADAEIGDAAKYRVAAVLAYQRAHGVEIAPPEASATPRTAALDLGQDHALPETADAARREARRRLRASVRKLLGECMELGLSHLSEAIAERYSTLAVWAQGADYHRLARSLRRLADHVELLLARAGGADEHLLFEEATLVHALVAALEAADANGSAPANLVGRARNRYEALGELELLGLGAMPWRTSSGYVGLTMLFWSPAEQGFFSCTDARPEGQRGGFDAVERYWRPGPWSGLGAPERATGRRLRLADAQVSDRGRLSATEKASVRIEQLAAAEFVAALAPVSDWSALAEARAFARRSLLSEPEPLRDWAVLRPVTCGVARFDPTRQVLTWPIVDASGARLDCEIAYSALSHPAIERLQAMTPDSFTSGTMVVARIRDSNGAPVADPLSLIRTDGALAVDALYFDAAPAEGLLSKALGKWRQLTAGPEPRMPPIMRTSSLPPALDALRVFLQRQAERGLGAAAIPTMRSELETHGRRLADVGLTGFAPVPDTSAAEQLLRAHYLVLQLARLLGADTQGEAEVA